ncbi:unnamed protein product, partial [Prorocentrum cordatum]
MGGSGRRLQHGFQKCSKCQYTWTWRTRSACFNCGHCLSPASSPARSPDGAWSDRAASADAAAGRARPASRPPWQEARLRPDTRQVREETLLETIKRRKEELPLEASQALAGLEAALQQPTATAPKPELPDEAAQRAWGAARRATKALNEALDATEGARAWLAKCQAKEDELAAEYALALEEQARAIAHAKGCLKGEQATPASVSVNLSSVLEGREGLNFELGVAFDLDGISLTEQEQADWEKTLEQFKQDFTKQVEAMFKPAAEELEKRREGLKKMQEEFRAKTKKRRMDSEAARPAGEPDPPGDEQRGAGRDAAGHDSDAAPGTPSQPEAAPAPRQPQLSAERLAELKKAAREPFTFDSANGSGWGPLTTIWGRPQERAQELAREAHAGQCWLAQETHLHEEEATREEQWLRRQGLRDALTPGTSHPGSLDTQQRRAASGGTGGEVWAARGAAQPLRGAAAGTRSKRVHPGRRTCLHFEGPKRGGGLAASVYLDIDRQRPTSWEVPRTLGHALRASGRSFVIGGDVNVEPALSADAARFWLEAVRGQVVCNEEGLGTCHVVADAPPSELDYFIVASMFGDCPLRHTGSEAQVGIMLGKAARAVIRGLERGMGAVVSRDKSEILGTTERLHRLSEYHMDEGSFAHAKETRNLGVRCAMGARAGEVAAGRHQAAAAQLGRAHQRSKLAAIAFGTGPGRSICLSNLLAAKPWDDPLFDHIARPMEAWARALQQVKEQDRRALGSAFAAARERLTASGPEGLAGRGPASAAALAAARLGWRADHIRHTFQREVQAAFIRKHWKDVASHDPLRGHLEGGAAINGLRRRLAKQLADRALASRWSSARQWEADDLNISYFYDTGGPMDSDAEHAIWSRCL